MSKIVEIEVKANVQWKAVPGAKSGVWIGICDALGLSVEACSLDELHSIIPESIHLLMFDLAKDNEFDAYLKERGWSATNFVDGNRVPDDLQFHVPWQLTAEGLHDISRRAH